MFVHLKSIKRKLKIRVKNKVCILRLKYNIRCCKLSIHQKYKIYSFGPYNCKIYNLKKERILPCRIGIQIHQFTSKSSNLIQHKYSCFRYLRSQFDRFGILTSFHSLNSSSNCSYRRYIGLQQNLRNIQDCKYYKQIRYWNCMIYSYYQRTHIIKILTIRIR